MRLRENNILEKKRLVNLKKNYQKLWHEKRWKKRTDWT